MTDTSKTVEDSLYSDNFGSGGGAYAYDPYQESGSQWLYNDNQALQAPQADVNAAELSAGAASSTSNVGANRGTYGASASVKDEGKLFVGGLSWETDEIKLRNYFSRYGNIVDCTIMRDPMSSRPRGFGFVTFDSMDSVNAVLQEPSHNLDGKAIDPKHAVPREGQATQRRNYNYNNQGMGGYGSGSNAGAGGDSGNDPVQAMKGEKIFVGRLPPSITEADLHSAFSEFGSIVEAKLMLDRETGRSRNFGFLQFETEEAALEAVKVGNSVGGIIIHGQSIDVKPAFHKKRPQMTTMGMMGGAGASNNAYGMMGMPGYGMMGVPGYGMMGMPGYGMMGMMGANGNMDYSAAMNYGNFYGNMGGYYGAGAQGDGSGAPSSGDASGAAATAATGYYGQMGMPNNGFYGGDGTDGNLPDQSSGVGNAGATGGGSGDKGGSSYYDQQDGGSGNNYSYNSKGSRHGDERGSGRDGGGYRSSTRRHGGGANDRSSGGRSDRSRTGDHSGSNSNSNSGNRSRDDHRSSRGGRPGRDRDGPVRGSHGNSSSRGHGYTPY
ncbi:hypothetical protein IWW37_002943 [Coemansia sp. RSA 2050]|nr:hypothetical protein IWW37_002943 [Coemansia sp. RSA 2050]KAJ2732517.1 hypothetical protein IW152_003724 [Coemansia sp. BCRC 34962]